MKKGFFFIKPSRISGQVSSRANNPVTGNQDRDGIAADRVTDRLSGHRASMKSGGNFPCEATVAFYLSVGNPEKFLPDKLLKRRSVGGKRDSVRRHRLSRKIPSKKRLCFQKNREGFFRRNPGQIGKMSAEMFLPNKPESLELFPVRQLKRTSERKENFFFIKSLFRHQIFLTSITIHGANNNKRRR